MRLACTQSPTRSLARSVCSYTLLALLVLTGFGWNPLTSFERRPVWSVCGQDMCACQPAIESAPEPDCPLCPSPSEPDCGGGASDDTHAAESQPPLRWVPDRFDERIPMAVELVAVTLVLPVFGRSGSLLPQPVFVDVVGETDAAHAWSRHWDIDPPPPRPVTRSA